MTNEELERKVDEINENVRNIDRKSNRILGDLPGLGLYTMVFFSMFNSCESNIKIQEVLRAYSGVQTITVSETPKLINRQALGEEAPKLFYEVGGKRAYVEIDGNSVEDYFPDGVKEDKDVEEGVLHFPQEGFKVPRGGIR